MTTSDIRELNRLRRARTIAWSRYDRTRTTGDYALYKQAVAKLREAEGIAVNPSNATNSVPTTPEV